MVRIFFLTILLAVINIANAQVDSIPADVRNFILPGYEPLDYIKGDLNADKRSDVILILKQIGEDSLSISGDESLRPFLLLIRQPDNKLKQVLRNDHVIMCRQCGGVFGDPYADIMTFSGGFSLHFYGGSSWRWAYVYKFSYKPLKKNWYLVNELQSSFQAGDPEATMKDVTISETELGPVPLEKFNSDPPYEDSRWKVIALQTYFYDNPKLLSKPRRGFLLKGNIATGIRELKNFVEVSYDNGKGMISSGYVLKKDLQKIQ